MIWAVGHRLAPQAMKRIERSMGTSNANRDTWRAKAAISAVSGLESGHWPAARRGLAGKPHSFQLAKPRQPQRAVGDAARIGRRVPEVHETLAGLGDQRPIDAGEAVLINLGRKLALLLDRGDRTEFERHQLACPLANAMGDVIAVDDQVLAQLIPTVDDDVNMRMAGIKMVHGDPIELRSQVTFEFGHEVAGEAGEVADLRAVLGRDDDAKLVAVVLAAIEEGVAVGPVLRR